MNNFIITLIFIVALVSGVYFYAGYLTRTGKAEEAFSSYNSSIDGENLSLEEKTLRKINYTSGKNEVFPIPLEELNLANATDNWGQNPGY